MELSIKIMRYKTSNESTEISDSSQTDLEAAMTQEKMAEVYLLIRCGMTCGKAHPIHATDDHASKNFSAVNNFFKNIYYGNETSRLSEEDKMIAMALIDAINEHGFLSIGLEDIQQSLNQQNAEEFH